MKGLLLIGGQATRLYPLSKYLAKSLMPICDRELLHYQIGALARAGISEIVLAVGYHAEQIRDYVVGYSGLSFAISEETEPLGTAGAIANAADLLAGDQVVVLNADILCDVDIAAVVAQHNAAHRPATLMAVEVEDPTRYGLLKTTGDSIVGFSEKPEGAIGLPPFHINAGLYVLEPQVVAGIPSGRAVSGIPSGRAVSIEREVFPRLLAECGALTLHVHSGLWRDIGTFESWFAANFELLGRRFALGETSLWGERDDCAVFKDLVYLHLGATLGQDAELYHRAIVMSGCEIGACCRLENTIVMPGAKLGPGSRLASCIVGPNVALPDGLQAENRLFIAGEESQAFYPEAIEKLL